MHSISSENNSPAHLAWWRLEGPTENRIPSEEERVLRSAPNASFFSTEMNQCRLVALARAVREIFFLNLSLTELSFYGGTLLIGGLITVSVLFSAELAVIFLPISFLTGFRFQNPSLTLMAPLTVPLAAGYCILSRGVCTVVELGRIINPRWGLPEAARTPAFNRRTTGTIDNSYPFLATNREWTTAKLREFNPSYSDQQINDLCEDLESFYISPGNEQILESFITWLIFSSVENHIESSTHHEQFFLTVALAQDRAMLAEWKKEPLLRKSAIDSIQFSEKDKETIKSVITKLKERPESKITIKKTFAIEKPEEEPTDEIVVTDPSPIVNRMLTNSKLSQFMVFAGDLAKRA